VICVNGEGAVLIRKVPALQAEVTTQQNGYKIFSNNDNDKKTPSIIRYFSLPIL
jgi:hypothetical protein